jgi:hypothetical protein
MLIKNLERSMVILRLRLLNKFSGTPTLQALHEGNSVPEVLLAVKSGSHSHHCVCLSPKSTAISFK